MDYQNNFVDGPLGFAQARQIEPALCEKLNWYHEGGYDVIFTMDTFFENATAGHPSADADENWAWQLYGNIEKLRQPSDRILSKHTFGSADLFELLRREQYDAVELAGVVSHVCVLVNAVLCQAALPEAAIQIDARCVAGSDAVCHEEALHIMENLKMVVLNR